MHPDAQRLVEQLGLIPHPEGGYFRETFRAAITVDGIPHGAMRSASTAIYFLLPAPVFSAVHRIKSDEVWHHYDGDPMDLHTFAPSGEHTVTALGRDYARGERPQYVVAAGLWQAAVPRGERFALCGCTVAPGFDFADFEMPSRAELVTRFPAHRTLIEQLTRE